MTENHEGLSEFFIARRRSLSRTAFFLTGSDQAAEDLIQAALVKVIPRWRRVCRRGDPEAYVRSIMINEVRSKWRRAQVIRETPISMQDLSTLHPAYHDDSPRTLDREELGRALRQLSPRQRTVLYLRFYEDLSERETASQMHCSVGTVKSQTHDALRKIRKLLPQDVEVTHDAKP